MADGGVVLGGALEDLDRELAPEFGQGDRRPHRVEHGVIVVGIAHDRHTLVVLGGAAQHCRAANVDVLNGLPESHVGLRHGLLERIKVHHHQVDERDVVGLGLTQVFGLVAPAEQSAVNFRMQRLHPAIHDFGKAGVPAHLGDREPPPGEKLGCAPRGKNPIAKTFDQGGRKFDQPAFIAHRKEGQLHHSWRVCAAQPYLRQAERLAVQFSSRGKGRGSPDMTAGRPVTGCG